MRQIARATGVSQTTVARVCRVAGVSRLRQLEPAATPVRYEREHAGELLHIDIKRLERFDRVGHRITRQRSFGSKKQGFEFVYVATDDFIRPYTPRTNGKAERFIQTLREWAYRFTYTSSEERRRWLGPYMHFYNFHRAHASLAYNPPVSRPGEEQRSEYQKVS